MNKIIYILSLFSIVLSSAAYSMTQADIPVRLEWKMGQNNFEGDAYSNSFVITNISHNQLDSDWEIYYNQITRKIISVDNPAVNIEEVKTNLYRITPTKNFKTLPVGGSLVVPFVCQGGLIKESHSPEGAYFVRLRNGVETDIVDIKIQVLPFDNSKQWNIDGAEQLPYPDGEYVYAFNSRFQKHIDLKQTDIFPSVKSAAQLKGRTILGKDVTISYPEQFAGEANYLVNKLHLLYGIDVQNGKNAKIRFNILKGDAPVANSEYYELSIDKDRIEISAATSHGAFNGVQTLLGMMKNQNVPVTLNNVSVTDYPDLAYRGIMIDIARNYTSKENLLKLIDRLSSYKINRLHIHLSDDEGWRIQIPGIEELTSVGAVRAHTLDESQSLYPNYSGGAFPSDKGSGYYTVSDFVEILRYAKERHITVIPEIDLPGHSRAAIVAMKARYNKYIATDKQKAEEYLLNDFTDRSVYVSAQGYSDNVINVALPSVYKFVEKVVDEIAAMYNQAGIPLTNFHIGCDEVPKGAWGKSDVCIDLMKSHNMLSAGNLEDYFITKVSDMLHRKGVNVAAWQEAGLNRDESVNPQHVGAVNSLYSWNTLPDWHGDRIPYSLANAGYDVILCNLTNFYFDLAYNKHQSEPGHIWAGFINEYSSFDMLPYNVYQSTRRDLSGNLFDLNNMSEGKPALTTDGRKHIKGVQGQLFCETMRGYDMVEYYLFPKMFGLAERGWNATPDWSKTSDWSDTKSYDEALSVYNAKIAKGELPRLKSEHCNFRLSQPGIIIREGKLYANSAVVGAEIRYTTDNSEPTVNSPLWTEPIDCSAKVVKAKLFYQGKQSVTTLLDLR